MEKVLANCIFQIRLNFYAYFIWPFIKQTIPKLHVMSEFDTLEKILNNHLSCIRFGDGEFNLMVGGKGPSFQDNSPRMRKLLREVLQTSSSNILVCVPGTLVCDVLDKGAGVLYTKKARNFWRYFLILYKSFIKNNISENTIYGNALITRPYIDRLDRDFMISILNLYKEIFRGRDVIIVEGEKTRFGVGNDLLDGVNSVKRIIAPSKNAFDFYDQLVEVCWGLCNSDPNILFLVSLGPTAKLLVKRISDFKGQALDIGHLDIEYEWFRRNEKTKSPVSGKCVNESKDQLFEDELDLSEYRKEIYIDLTGKVN